jgi:hypothetical protein
VTQSGRQARLHEASAPDTVELRSRKSRQQWRHPPPVEIGSDNPQYWIALSAHQRVEERMLLHRVVSEKEKDDRLKHRRPAQDFAGDCAEGSAEESSERLQREASSLVRIRASIAASDASATPP